MSGDRDLILWNLQQRVDLQYEFICAVIAALTSSITDEDCIGKINVAIDVFEEGMKEIE